MKMITAEIQLEDKREKAEKGTINDALEEVIGNRKSVAPVILKDNLKEYELPKDEEV